MVHSPAQRVDVQPRAGAALDYSFKDLKSALDVLHEESLSGTPKRKPIGRDINVNEYLDSLEAGAKSSAAAAEEGEAGVHSPSAPLNSTSVRLCNNHLTSLKGLDKVLHHLLDEPSELTWLDASCNQLASIEDIILKFPKLQSLYLHGNHITSLHDVHKLSGLEHLSKLTLHGNPVAEKHNYKLWVCAHLPKLRSLDFSTITRIDRDKVATWHRGYLKQQADK